MYDKERELAILAERYRTYETIEQQAITRTKQEILELITVLKEECERRHWLLNRDELNERKMRAVCAAACRKSAARNTAQ